jgi:Skp family chaperone for outer membrane proteins
MKKFMLLVSAAMVAPLMSAQDTKVEPRNKKEDLMIETKNVTIGYVDSAVAMRSSKEGQKLSKELEDKREQLSAQLKKEESVLIKDMESFKARSTTMSELERDAEQKRLIKAERDLKSKVEEAELELKMAMQRTMEALGKEIEAAVREIAVAQNLDVVIDTRTGQTLYAANKAVYTDVLVKEMDKNYSVKLAKNSTIKKQVTA